MGGKLAAGAGAVYVGGKLASGIGKGIGNSMGGGYGGGYGGMDREEMEESGYYPKQGYGGGYNQGYNQGYGGNRYQPAMSGENRQEMEEIREEPEEEREGPFNIYGIFGRK